MAKAYNTTTTIMKVNFSGVLASVQAVPLLVCKHNGSDLKKWYNDTRGSSILYIASG